jgi:putative membrane protein
MSIVSQQLRRGFTPALRLVAMSAVLLAAAALPVASQQRDVAAKRDRMPAETEPPVIWSQPDPPTEANIAAMLVAADESAVKDADLAQAKSSDPKVQSYAKTVAADHTALEDRVVAWTQAKKLEPVENPTSRQFISQGDKSRKKLEGVDPSQFDRGFASEQVKFDKALMAALDDIMIPNAKDPELASLLKGARPQVEAHMKQAEQLRSSHRA